MRKNSIMLNDEFVEMASAIRDLGFDCSEYTDEELVEAYKEIVVD